MSAPRRSSRWKASGRGLRAAAARAVAVGLLKIVCIRCAAVVPRARAARPQWWWRRERACEVWVARAPPSAAAFLAAARLRRAKSARACGECARRGDAADLSCSPLRGRRILAAPRHCGTGHPRAFTSRTALQGDGRTRTRRCGRCAARRGRQHADARRTFCLRRTRPNCGRADERSLPGVRSVHSARTRRPATCHARAMSVANSTVLAGMRLWADEHLPRWSRTESQHLFRPSAVHGAPHLRVRRALFYRRWRRPGGRERSFRTHTFVILHAAARQSALSPAKAARLFAYIHGKFYGGAAFNHFAWTSTTDMLVVRIHTVESTARPGEPRRPAGSSTCGLKRTHFAPMGVLPALLFTLRARHTLTGAARRRPPR